MAGSEKKNPQSGFSWKSIAAGALFGLLLTLAAALATAFMMNAEWLPASSTAHFFISLAVCFIGFCGGAFFAAARAGRRRLVVGLLSGALLLILLWGVGGALGKTAFSSRLFGPVASVAAIGSVAGSFLSTLKRGRK